MKIDRYLDIELESKSLSTTGEYGDSFDIENKYETNIFSSNVFNIQTNALVLLINNKIEFSFVE